MKSIEQKIVGVWRSYKLFCFSGKVEHHNTSFYIEFSIDEHNSLTLYHSQLKRQAIVLKSGDWKVEEFKKRWYLYFGKKQAYEFITVESNDLVLANPVKGEKIFFAKMPEWNHRIEPIVNAVKHIKPNAETKDR